jgi:hypothetical protein
MVDGRPRGIRNLSCQVKESLTILRGDGYKFGVFKAPESRFVSFERKVDKNVVIRQLQELSQIPYSMIAHTSLVFESCLII